MNVPISRMEAENNFSLGRSTEITRDELKFTKFVQRLRKKFTPLFTDMLKAQLILKGIITVEDWDRMKEHIQYNFLQDGHFAELKKAEILQDRINALQSIETYIGTFYSKGWVQRNVLNMTDGEIDEMKKTSTKKLEWIQMMVELICQIIQMVSQDIHKILQAHSYHLMIWKVLMV